MKYKKIYLFFITILATLLTQSCAPVIIKMDQTPELQGGSPLRGIEPLTFVIKDFGDEVGEIVFSDPKLPQYHVVKIDRPATIIVTQAIAAELKRNGHKVLPTQDTANADIIIDGIVTKYWIEYRPTGWNAIYNNHAEAKITVTKVSSPNESVSKLYRGIYEGQNYANPSMFPDKWKISLNESVLNMVKDFTMDPDFIDILKKAKKAN